MNKTFSIVTLLAASVAVLLTPMSSFAVDIGITFNYDLNSNVPSEGSGSMSASFQVANDPNGNPQFIEFSAPMPTPDFFFQKDTFNVIGEEFDTVGVPHPDDPNFQVHAVGYSNTVLDFSPVGGNANGFYMGWGSGDPNAPTERVVVLNGSLNGVDYTLPVPLRYTFGDQQYWNAVQFDNLDPLTGFDVDTGDGNARFAGYVGHSLNGHRHSGDNRQHQIGQDIFKTDNGNPNPNPIVGNTLDGSGYNDTVGITLGLRAYADATGLGGAIYIGDLNFGGTLFKNAVAIFPQVVFPGDVNRDFVVNKDDFDIILANFNTSVSTQLEGDLNNDDFVDFTDFSLFKAAFLAGGGLMSELYGVPEPSTAVLVVMFAAVCSLRRTRAHLPPV